MLKIQYTPSLKKKHNDTQPNLILQSPLYPDN